MRHFTHKHSFFTLLIICLALGYKKLSNSAFVDYNEPGSYRIQALNIPTEIQFAGESMQLTETDLIERMDKELLVNTYWQSNTILMLKELISTSLKLKKSFPKRECQTISSISL